MYIEYPTQAEALQRAAQASQELGYGKGTPYAGGVIQTNSDTFMWRAVGSLTEAEQAKLVETYEPKAWEDLI